MYETNILLRLLTDGKTFAESMIQCERFDIFRMLNVINVRENYLFTYLSKLSLGAPHIKSKQVIISNTYCFKVTFQGYTEKFALKFFFLGFCMFFAVLGWLINFDFQLSKFLNYLLKSFYSRSSL